MRPQSPIFAWTYFALGTLALGGLAGVLGCRSGQDRSDQPGYGAPFAFDVHPVDVERGEQLFELHCAVCHGERGEADGPASNFLFPTARDISSGKFRLVSSTNGAPQERDLVATLRRGMPGSSMPSFHWLPMEDLWSIAGFVRELARDGVADDLRRAGQSDEETVLAMANARVTAADPHPEVRLMASSAEVLARGELLYGTYCATCHGEEGRGESEPRYNEDGSVNWARDFTAGFMKGGSTHQDLAHRILSGIPGTAMPSTLLEDPDDLAALVAYVRYLIPEGSESRLVLRRRKLHASRVSSLDGIDHDDERWRQTDRIEINLAPLWWRKNSIRTAALAALHDGDSIAIRVAWLDETNETRVFEGAQRSDAVALQFSKADGPPLFGMGSKDHPTHIWHWKSLRMSEVGGVLDLMDQPHVVGSRPLQDVRPDVPLYHPLEGLPAVSRTVLRMQVEGVESAGDTERLPESNVTVMAHPALDGWDVIFLRKLSAQRKGDLEFKPAQDLQVAVAVWNGAAGDAGPQKAISIWQQLQLER